MNISARLLAEVRPTGVLALAEAVEAGMPFGDPLIMHGDDPAAFLRLAPLLGWGTAVLLCGQPTTPDGAPDLDAAARAHDFHWWNPPGLPPDCRCWVKHVQGGGYGGHLPVLLEAVRRTAGPVLELGAGEASTPALHRICEDAGRLLVTVDNQAPWLDRFAPLASDGHRFELLADPATTAWLDREWSVVFVDHAPGETRGKAIDLARDAAEIICVHDSEELGYQLEPILTTFRYRYDHRVHRPWTTVISDRVAWK